MSKNPPAAETPPYAAPALDKGLDILEALTDAEAGLSMAELAGRLGRSISEIFRMVVTLQRRGWITADAGDRYRLSSKMFELAHRHRPTRTLVEAAVPTLQSVARQAHQSCHLTIIESGRVMVIAHVDAPGVQSFNVRTGSVVGLFNTASGHVLLAFRTPDERARLIADHTLVSGESAVSKAVGTSASKTVTRDAHVCAPSPLIRGVTNIGAPVRGRNGDVVAALVIPYLEGLGPERGPGVDEARGIVLAGAAEIARALGYQGPAPTA
jgi:DNA-binding IclR family transcriptional regulator